MSQSQPKVLRLTFYIYKSMSLENIIIILDKYAVLITGVATVILVVATIILAMLNYYLWKAQDRPHLYFTKKFRLVTAKHRNLYVINIGKGVALDTEFKILDKLYTDYHILPQNIEIVISAPDINVDKDQIKIKGIRYKDINGKSYFQNDIIM